MPEVVVIRHDLGIGEFLLRNVRDVALDAEQLFCLEFERCIEHEGLAFLFWFPDESGTSSWLLARQQFDGPLNLPLQFALIFPVSRLGEATDNRDRPVRIRVTEAPDGLICSGQ